MIDLFQLAMVAVLIAIGQHFAAVLRVADRAPITFQDIWLLRDPVAFDGNTRPAHSHFCARHVGDRSGHRPRPPR